MSTINGAVTMAQRGYDRGVADRATSGGPTVERTLRNVKDVLIDAGVAVKSPDGSEELVEVSHRLAEEAGHLLALAEPVPSGPSGSLGRSRCFSTWTAEPRRCKSNSARGGRNG